jgi:hypothetical protein
MQPYKNSKSGVSAFEIHETKIILEFRDGGGYLYDYKVPGKKHVEQMKKLALQGKGLATYVNQHVREHYKAKLF